LHNFVTRNLLQLHSGYIALNWCSIMLRPCVAGFNSMSYVSCCKLGMSEKEMCQRGHQETANKLRCEKLMFPTPCSFHCRAVYTVQNLKPSFYKDNKMYCIDSFFLSFNLLIVWQIFIWNHCKTFLLLPYNFHLLCSWRLALSILVEVFLAFFPGIAPLQIRYA